MNNYTFKVINSEGVKKEATIRSPSKVLNYTILNRLHKMFSELGGALYVAEGIEAIDSIAASNMLSKVKTLHLPSTLQKIYSYNSSAFYFPLCVERIIVSDDNPYFSSDKDGVLFSKDKSVLIRYPIGKLNDCYEIPPTVTEIAAFAFAQAKIKFLTAPKSVSVIGEQAFQYSQLISADFSETKIEVLPKECFWICSDLVSIKLPKSLKSIKTKCFCQCGFENIEIPNTVAKIEKYAFSSSKIKEIKMPRDLKHITRGVFQNCEKIEKIDLCNIIKIHKTTFTNCPYLSEITANTYNKAFSTKDGVLYNKDFTKLFKTPPAYNKEKFVVPDSVKIIDEAAFESCLNLVELDIGNAILVEDSALFNCTSLKKITIGSECKEFSPEKVKFCFALERIEVDPNNPYYKSVDGVLFNKSGEKLLIYPPAKPDGLYSVPDGTSEISECAFFNVQNLTEVKLPDSVKYIGDHTFERCSKLQKIDLSRVIRIGRSAFSCCEHLDNIIFNDNAVLEDYSFSFCSELKNVELGNNLKIQNNSFMKTPFNNFDFDFFNANAEELSKAFASAYATADFLLSPRYYKNNYWR